MKKQALCLSAADIHGNRVQYEKLRNIVIEKGISFVFLCGDLLPKDGGLWHPDNKVRTIEMQANFISSYFLDYLTELGRHTTVYAIFGNDDFKSNYYLVEEAQLPNVHFLCNEVERLPVAGQELYVAGYPYVGLTPFLHKDWEKWDEEIGVLPHKTYRADGYSSENGKHVPVDRNTDPSTIKNDLEHLAILSNPKKTLYIFHEAPYNTPLDIVAPDNKYINNGDLHVGSPAVREFIQNKHPLMTMHGHIHETFDQSGDFQWRQDGSISVTAANDFSSDILWYVLFSLPGLSHIERLSV